MSEKNEEYMLGSSDEELERLGFQHQVWLGETHELWRSADFGPGDRLADLGCGPGFATLDLARLVRHEGRIDAVDASQKFIGYLRDQLAARGPSLGHVHCHSGDIKALPLEDASLDGAFARWLLCFVEKPEEALAEIVRVLRPGGRLVILDYFNYMAAKVLPGLPEVNALFAAYYQSAKVNGGNYDIGNDLPEMLACQGFEVEKVNPIVKLGRPGSKWWHWVSSFNKVYVPKLVELGIWTEAERMAFERGWKTVTAQPNAMFFTPPMIGIVAKRRAD